MSKKCIYGPLIEKRSNSPICVLDDDDRVSENKFEKDTQDFFCISALWNMFTRLILTDRMTFKLFIDRYALKEVNSMILYCGS